jgi:hypothetical protein
MHFATDKPTKRRHLSGKGTKRQTEQPKDRRLRENYVATEKAAAFLERKRRTADRVTDKAANKASSSLRKKRRRNRKCKAGDKAESSLESKRKKATKRLAEQPQQRRRLWREGDQETDRETDTATDKAALSPERERNNNRRSGFFSLRKATK